MKPTEPTRNLLTAIEQANKLAQLFGLQFFAYVSDGNQKEHLTSNLVLSDLETVVGGLREWMTGVIPEPTCLCTVVIEDTALEMLMTCTSKCTEGGVYVWDYYNHKFSPNEYLMIFGPSSRWFIQPINLPKK